MKKMFFLWMGVAVSAMTWNTSYAQEEQESAEVYLEEYTDEFQENFFEALKQKGIQNYDRAIDLFLKCKQLDPNDDVVDYELSKAYLLDKKFVQAQEYAIEALLAEPSDYWYLDNLVSVLEQQGSPLETIKAQIPYENQKLRENLALCYFKRKQYADAQKILKELNNSPLALELGRKINDSIQGEREKTAVPVVQQEERDTDDPVAQLRTQLEKLLAASDYKNALTVSKEALDTYPLQPYFYFAYGTALNNTSNANKAIEVLESGLDYLLEDGPLQNNMYRELSKAYTQIGNTQKANEYLNKINSGS
ncbi:tetratricopeptide repeat protein [Flagellimonas aequoris]|uniref:Tetratricopeptide repeat protein n=1 Tax=Flagellimonas aequoris TaxID=2306997 RepID=A0A418NA41_9FLAO|nr:hypothetical protein [Allomuricauda aequoris]RIV72821.1 hypothetical protein D2U88_04105 [Allomuricauda aequoris]TXK05328.1 hypothetical protein FQ019_04080 [Allomuricauda aequoris]